MSSDAARRADALPDAVRALARCLSAGLAVAPAVARAAEASDPRLAPVLVHVSARLAAGLPPEEACADLAAIDGGPLVAAALVVHAEVGGDLVAALRGIAASLDGRRALRRELAVATAPARASARAAAAIPALMAAVLAIGSPGMLTAVATRPPALAAVGCGATLVVTGVALANRAARRT